MLLRAIPFDAAMSASAALARLARHGLWEDPQHPAARPWIQAQAARVGLPFDEAARQLARSAHLLGAAIRRQWYANVLWYGLPAEAVLHRCLAAPPEASLVVALDLHEDDSRPPLEVPPDGAAPDAEGVVLAGDTPVGVSLMLAMAGPPPKPGRGGATRSAPPPHRPPAPQPTRSAPSPPPPSPPSPGAPPPSASGNPLRRFLSRTRSAAEESTPPSPTRGPAPVEVHAWPAIDAPQYVQAGTAFDVEVGLAQTRQVGVTGGEVTLSAPAGSRTIDVTIELLADGVEARDGWSRLLSVAVDDPTATRVSFHLVAQDPAGPEPVHLTTLEVRYLVDGSVCGTAARPLAIGTMPASDLPAQYGIPWLNRPASASPVTVRADAAAADLTIEFAKPDGNAASGRYVCRLYSPHPITTNRGPHVVDFGDDARTFAKGIVEQVRQYETDPIVENLLASVGDLVAEKLPPAAWTALREVAAKVAPEPPAVLIVSAEPYVPWELARLNPPLDPARPPFLGAQALVGRWLRDTPMAATFPAPATGTTGPAPTTPVQITRPPAQPPARVEVRHMAVLAGMYRAESGLRRLPEAEAEAETLTTTYHAVSLPASLKGLKELLDAQIEGGVGGADAVHFAGHGEFDPSRSDASVLFLSDGRPLSSLLFRSARYGGKQQPLLMLNACMIGIGGELLGDMGGFPGNCLKGGFGGVLGALWEVDDEVAHQVALEFWQRALPTGSEPPEPVGAILRDLRGKYLATPASPVPTYLAYVYYGHPRLTLRRPA